MESVTRQQNTKTAEADCNLTSQNTSGYKRVNTSLAPMSTTTAPLIYICLMLDFTHSYTDTWHFWVKYGSAGALLTEWVLINGNTGCFTMFNSEVVSGQIIPQRIKIGIIKKLLSRFRKRNMQGWFLHVNLNGTDHTPVTTIALALFLSDISIYIMTRHETSN